MKKLALARTRRASVAAMLLATVPAAAQLRPEIGTGSHIPVQPEQVDAREAVLIRHSFAACLYHNNPSGAVAVLAHSDPLHSDLRAAGIGNASRAFQMDDCLGLEVGPTQLALGLRMQQDMLGAMLEEPAYLARQRLAPTLPADAVEVLPRTFVSESDELPRARAMAALADCVVFHNVAGADALVRSSPGSSPEHAMAAALAPAFGSCLTQGQHFNLNAQSMRSIVADGLWNRFGRSARGAAG